MAGLPSLWPDLGFVSKAWERKLGQLGDLWHQECEQRILLGTSEAIVWREMGTPGQSCKTNKARPFRRKALKAKSSAPRRGGMSRLAAGSCAVSA